MRKAGIKHTAGMTRVLALILVLLTAGCTRNAPAASDGAVTTEAHTANTDAPQEAASSENSAQTNDTSLTATTQDSPQDTEAEQLAALSEAVAGDAYTLMCEIASSFPDRDSFAKESGHDDSAEYIVTSLLSAGYDETQITRQRFDESEGVAAIPEGCNIVLTLTGKRTDLQIVAGAHYDGNGAGDNASGVALLLSAARSLSGITPDVTVHFVFFDQEEIDLLGSRAYVKAMTEEEKSATLFMINLDALVFGDYCHIYGGMTEKGSGLVTGTEGYEKAAARARALGIAVMGPKDLDGYYETHGRGPVPDDHCLYTNPWTAAHPAPSEAIYEDLVVYSPSTVPMSDHVHFALSGIPCIYFEATNWFAAGDNPHLAYTGYYETTDTSLGDHGMFMKTEHDTLENMNTLFPGRAQAHFELYAPLLLSLLLHPSD